MLKTHIYIPISFTLLAHECLLALLFMDSICSDFSRPLRVPQIANIFLRPNRRETWTSPCVHQNSLSGLTVSGQENLKFGIHVRFGEAPSWKGEKPEKKARGREAREEKSSGGVKKSNYFWIKLENLWVFLWISDSRHVNLISCLQLPQTSIPAFHNKDEKEISQVIKLLNRVYCVVNLN